MALIRDSSVYCIPNATYKPFERKVVSGVSIGSSIVGFVGASLQLNYLWQYRNSRRRTPSPSPRIILYLALSDMFSCLGVFGLSVMVFFSPTGNNIQFETVFTLVLEVITVFSFLASCIWTFSYALDMCFQIYEIECPMIVYKILSWLIPLDVVFWSEFANMRDDTLNGYQTYACKHNDGKTSRVILSYIVVLAAMFGNPLLFVITYKRVKRLLKSSGRFTDEQREVLNKFKKKFFWIVFVFALCWVPNMILPLKELYVKPDQFNLSPLIFLGVEAFLNPLQGFFNYLVYRKAFKVEANETRTNYTSSRHVPLPYAFLTDNYGSTQKSDDSITDYTITRNKETPLFRSHSSAGRVEGSSDSYVCKLFGE